MKKAVLLLSALFVFAGTTAQAKLQEMNDSELASVYGASNIAAYLVKVLEQKINSGQNISGEELMSDLALISKAFGVSFENIRVSGATYGGLSVSLIKDGQVIGTTQLPSHIEHVYIGSVRAGNGPSMGALEIQGLNVTGQITVTVH
ncbi:hypothetical protein [Bdellovibrio sp. BCCA]|uniref:hypothetical protein n=1 Tax=Bdellovibrio sp. BCCA TaxID=3136281 RepID=UPI0030F0FC95